ncbi:MAG: protein phosphatase 2C domain-containing protein [Pseudomonadota bacterium]
MTDITVSAALAQDIGARDRQEDAALFHAPDVDEPTVAVLSDGMGGHDDGDLASRIIAREVFGELYIAAARPEALRRQSVPVLRAALDSANARLQQHINAGHLSSNTGGTLICATIQDNQLRWLSVGDSSLYLLRKGKISRLNELHSMATQLDLMVAREQMDRKTALAHPDRSCLTSAITGAEIPKIDCAGTGQALESGDIVLLASDGINVLSDRQIRKIMHRKRGQDSEAISAALLHAVTKRRAPDQDNTTVITLKVEGVPERRGWAFLPFSRRRMARHSAQAGVLPAPQVQP